MAKKKWPKPPNKVQITPKASYEVLYKQDFENDTTFIYGETRPKERQIILNPKQSDKVLYSTAIHEMIHALDMELDIGLTEAKVIKLEKGLVYLLNKNKWIMDT